MRTQKPINVFYPDGRREMYDSIHQASVMTGVSRGSIYYHLRNQLTLDGVKYEYCDSRRTPYRRVVGRFSKDGKLLRTYRSVIDAANDCINNGSLNGRSRSSVSSSICNAIRYSYIIDNSYWMYCDGA